MIARSELEVHQITWLPGQSWRCTKSHDCQVRVGGAPNHMVARSELEVHQITWLPGQSWRCSVKLIWSKCNEACDWCIYVTVINCADTITYTLFIQ